MFDNLKISRKMQLKRYSVGASLISVSFCLQLIEPDS